PFASTAPARPCAAASARAAASAPSTPASTASAGTRRARLASRIRSAREPGGMKQGAAEQQRDRGWGADQWKSEITGAVRSARLLVPDSPRAIEGRGRAALKPPLLRSSL